MKGKWATAAEAIPGDDVEQSIHNLTSIGTEAMCKTCDMVLSIMTSKDAKKNCCVEDDDQNSLRVKRTLTMG